MQNIGSLFNGSISNRYYGAYLEKKSKPNIPMISYTLNEKKYAEHYSGSSYKGVSIANYDIETLKKMDFLIDQSSDRYESMKDIFVKSDQLYYHPELGTQPMDDTRRLEGKFGKSVREFEAHGANQWLVFSKELYDNGFFEGKSDDEILQFESLLQQITDSMDHMTMFLAFQSGIDYLESAAASGSTFDSDTYQAAKLFELKEK